MKILYFAKIKEVIGKSEDSITINEQTTVKDIVEKLKIINESYKLAFQDLKNIKCSVNCNYIDSLFNWGKTYVKCWCEFTKTHIIQTNN